MTDRANTHSGDGDRLRDFAAVVETYEAPLLRYVRRMVASDDLAQDVVQNAFIRLYRRWTDPLSPSPQISAWLYRVAHNCAVDHLRNETRRRELHQRHAVEQPEHVGPNCGEGFHLSEAAEQVAAALQSLPLRDRQLVILKVYEEKSYKEISDITGLSVSNVGYILHHAMRRLADELKRIRAL
jgi:RNA polymerase sigma-70 factor (ECF subfamily)